MQVILPWSPFISDETLKEKHTFFTNSCAIQVDNEILELENLMDQRKGVCLNYFSKDILVYLEKYLR